MSGLDTGAPSLHFFSQATSTSSWRCHPAAERERVINDLAPAFVTVLNVGCRFDKDLTADELRAVKYHGPFYADFDGETIDEVIPQFHAFLGKLRDKGLDLNQVRLFATGGRGFHVEVPTPCFVPRGLPAEGVAGLPHIFRELAYELYVDMLDLRVYSAKKGRMWRVPNRQRDNGAYKVPVTADEALGMTAALYAALCSAPRPFPPLVAPTFCAGLGLSFTLAKGKVDAAKQRKRRTSAAKTEFQARFGRKLPGVIAALGAGQIPVRDGVGWNKVAMQLALLVNALGIDDGEAIRMFRGLIDSHVSDGRYNSPGKREAHLLEMLRYMEDNPCYDVEVSGLRSILPQGTRTLDFRGMA